MRQGGERGSLPPAGPLGCTRLRASNATALARPLAHAACAPPPGHLLRVEPGPVLLQRRTQLRVAPSAGHAHEQAAGHPQHARACSGRARGRLERAAGQRAQGIHRQAAAAACAPGCKSRVASMPRQPSSTKPASTPSIVTPPPVHQASSSGLMAAAAGPSLIALTGGGGGGAGAGHSARCSLHPGWRLVCRPSAGGCELRRRPLEAGQFGPACRGGAHSWTRKGCEARGRGCAIDMRDRRGSTWVCRRPAGAPCTTCTPCMPLAPPAAGCPLCNLKAYTKF